MTAIIIIMLTPRCTVYSKVLDHTMGINTEIFLFIFALQMF